MELGQLALALEQAGAYIAKNGLTFDDYAERWHKKHDQVIDWFDERLMQYPLSVAVTWQTSFDQLTQAGRELLNVLAWLAPDPIPESLLDAGGGKMIFEAAMGSADARAALADLEAYSLATRADEAPRFSVHRLVQDVTRRDPRDQRGCRRCAARWPGWMAPSPLTRRTCALGNARPACTSCPRGGHSRGRCRNRRTDGTADACPRRSSWSTG